MTAPTGPAGPRPAVAPARNRVTPTGTIVAAAGRGAFMGNRGRLHEPGGGRDIVRNFRSQAWLTCALSYRDQTLPQWEPGHNTQLFFLDEAVALAAGHRPCALCRRSEYNAFRRAWPAGRGEGPPRAAAMDRELHRHRLPLGARRPARSSQWASLPDGTFVLTASGPAVVVADHLSVYDETTNTYTVRLPRPGTGAADVLTPPPTLAVLRSGYPVRIADVRPDPGPPTHEAG